MDEDLIIEGLNRKDIKAFYAIYDLWFSQLLLFARKITGDEQEALDIATDVYATVWERHREFKSIDHLRSFLFAATRNSSISFRRSLKAKRNYADEVISLGREEENLIERYTAEAALLERLYDVINQLPQKQREVFTCCYVEGLKSAEVAKMLHISEKTVYAHCDQVLKKLRLVFSKQELLILFSLILQVCKN